MLDNEQNFRWCTHREVFKFGCYIGKSKFFGCYTGNFLMKKILASSLSTFPCWSWFPFRQWVALPKGEASRERRRGLLHCTSGQLHFGTVRNSDSPLILQKNHRGQRTPTPSCSFAPTPPHRMVPSPRQLDALPEPHVLVGRSFMHMV